MDSKKLVSVIIPTRNSDIFLENCLSSIKKQSYKNIEVIVVDNNSTDKTKEVAKEYTKNIFDISDLKKFKGKFSATYQRNYGVKKSKGSIAYYFDADMEMTKNVIYECVKEISGGAHAIIIHEDSFGSSFWAKCKQLERRCYWGDNSIEAPRCFERKVWEKLGGLDEDVAGGGDDWDLHEKLKENRYKVARIKSLVLHNEGDLKLSKLIKKRFLYGKDTVKYLKKRKATAFWQYFPIRKSFLIHWVDFLKNPLVGAGTIFMRIVEYAAGGMGIIFSKFSSNK